MGFVQGLAAAKELASKSGGGDYKERVKATWVSLKANEEVKLVFLQEIDKGSPNYSEKNGLANLVLEHQSPDDWKKSAECTIEEGSCYGCANGWRQKQVFYVNCLVIKGKEDPFVAVFSRGLGKGSVAQGLYNMAGDDDYNLSITDKVFKFSRTGSTKDDTTYTLTPLPKASEYNVEDYTDKLFDLEGVPFNVAPERQAKYYTGEDAPAAPAVPQKALAPESVDSEW